MELDSKKWNLTNSQAVIQNDKKNLKEKGNHDEDTETVSAKRQKLEETDESIECLRNICEEKLVEAEPSLEPVQKVEEKPAVASDRKKKKRKKDGDNTKQIKSEVKVKKEKEKSKAHMRKNIRDILKGDELEAETRAAQQREIERVQRLQQQQQQQQQQITDCNYIPTFDVDEDNTPASNLVEGLQALAKELEDSTLSPEIPVEFIDSNQQCNSVNTSAATIVKEEIKKESVKNQVYDDVICLSSDDEEFPPKQAPPPPIYSKRYVPDDDDDDVVILSGDDEKPEAAEEEDGDVHNFGLHTRDEFNKPDSEGRVLVNVGHPPNEADIFLAPQLARAAKSHQIGGIRFLYDNVVESLEQFSKSMGFGCILAHSMGLGKTFQVCAFSEVFLRYSKAKTVLIIVPINTIQNWVAEFNSWLPAEISSNRNPDDPPVESRSFSLHVLNDSTKDLNSRSRVITEWTNQGGVLLIGYEMYRLFYTQRDSKVKKRGTKKKKVSGFVDLEEEEKERAMLERIYQALVDPGPELVICDEGHRIKNMKASISVALKEIRTRRRVVLTGYPLQNNLLEYWCMVDFVRPNFLGTRTEFGNMFERPIQNGQCVDSNPADVKLMKERVYVLHSLVKGFVQRRSHSVLRSSLPHKQEHVLLLRMTPLQRALYRHHMSQLLQNKSVSNPLRAFAVCLKIWNHPDVFYNFFKKGKDDLDLELDEEAPESRKKKKNNAQALNVSASSSVPTPTVVPTDEEGGDGNDSVSQTSFIAGQGANDSAKEKKEESTSLDWADELMKGYVPGDIENAAKTQIFFTILEESVKIGDRLLVFSQSLFTLDMLEEFLQQRTIPNRGDERWSKHRSYFRLDGSTTGIEREKLVNEFNSNSDVLLFLISTRAGSLGINLIGANRVIVFDASWNPCHDAQAVCRVYRYGQKKPCFIYRLVVDNSLEKKIYDRQIGKQGTADRVVDELNPEARLSLKDVTSLVCDDEEDPPPKDFGADLRQQVSMTDPILGNVLQRWGHSFTQDPFQHDTLLLEGKDARLSKAEKRMAQRLYEKAKLDGTMQYRRQNYSNYYPRVPVPIPTIDHGSGSFARMNSMYTSGRPPTNLPIKPTLHPPLQGVGMDLLAEALAQGKLVCKEMVLNKDVTIARNQIPGGCGETTPIVLSSGTRVKLIRTPKGIYMQTPEGKIFRIHSSSPATPTSPSAVAAALGMNSKPTYPFSGAQSTSIGLPSSSGELKSSFVEDSALKSIRDVQPSLTDASQAIAALGDKSALLAQVRQSIAASKGFGKNLGNANVKIGESSSLTSGRSSLSIPPNLNHFAKQLASLAQKTTVDLLTDVGAGRGQSEVESNGVSCASPKRTSSLLDPKARALPSASLPKKVAAVGPNLSKARSFTSYRPTTTVEPVPSMQSSLHTSSETELQLMTSTSNSPNSALSALSALSSSPLTTKLTSFSQNFDSSSDSNKSTMKSETERRPALDNKSSRNGLFDKISLASQLEGFASCTSASKPTAESLKDLLKTTNNTGASENMASNYPWNDDQTSSVGSNASSWPEYPTWNNSQWGGTNSGSQMNWQWPPQQHLQAQHNQGNFNGVTNVGETSTVDPNVSSSDAFNQYSNSFDSNNQWANYNSATSSTNVTYPSHSLPSTGHYSGPPYFPTSYLGSNSSAYGTFPQSSPSGYTSLNSNYHNQYGGRGTGEFTPSYSQPYPGSFSQ